MLPIRQTTLRFSRLSFNILRHESSKASNPNNVSWSGGEKKKPPESFWREPEMWYKKDLFITDLNPDDPEHNYPYKREDGGIQYFRFEYYPRTEDEVDPPYEPSPLLMVIRRKPVRFTTYWEKNFLRKFGIGEYYGGRTTVVKNIPEITCKLWHIKHLVTIVPLRFPKEALEKDRNPLHYFIKEDGEVVYQPNADVREEDLKDIEDEKSMSKEWVCEQTRKIYHFSRKLEF